MQKWIIAGVALAILIAVLIGFGATRSSRNTTVAAPMSVSAPPRLAVKDAEPIAVRPSVWVPPVEDYNRPQVKTEAQEKAEALAALNNLKGRGGSGGDEIGWAPMGGGGSSSKPWRYTDPNGNKMIIKDGNAQQIPSGSSSSQAKKQMYRCMFCKLELPGGGGFAGEPGQERGCPDNKDGKHSWISTN